VAAPAVVEDLEVLEDRVGELSRVRHLLRFRSPVCSLAQNASIMALSNASPTRPIESANPVVFTLSLKAQEVN